MSTHQKNQNGFALVEGLLIIVALAAIATAGYFAYQARQNQNSASVDVATPAKVDAYKGWKVFSSKVNGLTFKYPADWANNITLEQPAPDFKTENGKIISPDGFELSVYNPPDGLGGACPDPCPIITKTFSAVPYKGIAGHNVYLVKQQVYDSSVSGDIGSKRIGLWERQSAEGFTEAYDSSQSTYQGFPPYLIFSKSKDMSTWLDGHYPETNPKAKLPLDQYFALPDLKKAELLLQSIKYNN